MRLFECTNCGQGLFFENTRCENCGYRLGFLPESLTLAALAGEGELRPVGDPQRAVKFCANAPDGDCNWLLDADSDEAFCFACRHNRTIPPISDQRNLAQWRLIEAAKRRLFYSLLRFRLALPTRPEDPEGLAFDFLTDPSAQAGRAPTVMTGHDHGLITLNLAEADDVERERRRNRFGEAYRTLLGHFRHEVGHYFWDRLIRDDPSITRFRVVFGDERKNYGDALRAHYADGAPPDWQDSFVSPYASSHPWEDFAETWAHYLHLVDTLETAHYFGMRISPQIGRGAEFATAIDFDPYDGVAFEAMIAAWLPLTMAVNSLNRSMGLPDLYPFVLSPRVIEKLAFVHDRLSGDSPTEETSGTALHEAVEAGQRNLADADDSPS